MGPHFVNLLSHSWNAMMKATGTTSLGFIVWALALIVVGWLAGVAGRAFQLRRKGAGLAVRGALEKSLWPGFFLITGVAGLVIVIFGLFVVGTVYNDHQLLVKDNGELIKQNKDLTATLARKRHSFDTDDPVFTNLIYLLQAFAVYRGYLNGEPCMVRITAPTETLPMAKMVAAFSVSVSNCPTFGPETDPELSPELEKETMDGMAPEMIVLHAARDDKAANELALRLGNQIQLKRSYEPPPRMTEYHLQAKKGRLHFLWLQFGTTNWNSERYPSRVTVR